MKKYFIILLVFLILFLSGCTQGLKLLQDQNIFQYSENDENSFDEYFTENIESSVQNECESDVDCYDGDIYTLDTCIKQESNICFNRKLSCRELRGNACSDTEMCSGDLIESSTGPCCLDQCLSTNETEDARETDNSNSCSGITCNAYCTGTTSYFAGICNNGQCNYQTQTNSTSCGYTESDLCDGITCNDYCTGTTNNYNGTCNNGQCNYQTQTNSTTCGYQEADLCEGVTCLVNHKCINGTCLWMTCDDLGGQFCNESEICGGVENPLIANGEFVDCCVGSCDLEETTEICGGIVCEEEQWCQGGQSILNEEICCYGTCRETNTEGHCVKVEVTESNWDTCVASNFDKVICAATVNQLNSCNWDPANRTICYESTGSIFDQDTTYTSCFNGCSLNTCIP